MSKMSEMHAIVATLSEKYGFDLDEALRLVDSSMADAPAPTKTKMVAMLDGQKVKRAQSAYIFYTNDARPQFKEQHPDKRVTELAKLMGAAWKELSEEEKAPFVAKAEADKARHADEMARAEMVPVDKKKKRAAKANTEAEAEAEAGETSPAVPPAPTLALADAEDETKDAAPAPKARAKRGPKAKIPLPFCGETMEDNCLAIRKNHGLYTQCQMGRVGGETLCKTCLKKKDALPYGVVADRATTLAALDIVPMRYCEVIEKMGISRAQAEGAATELGWTIPEIEFEAPAKKARKTKKKKASAAVDSTDDEAEPKAAKPDNRVVTTAKEGDDLITSLIQNAEMEAAGKNAPTGDAELEEEEEPLEVMVFEHDGVQYLRSNDGTIFDRETEEEIGQWNEETQQIVKA